MCPYASVSGDARDENGYWYEIHTHKDLDDDNRHFKVCGFFANFTSW